MAKSATNFTPTRRPPSRPAAREPLAYLQSDDKLASLLPTARQVAALQTDCEQLLPGMFASCRVLQLREHTLNIAVPNAALATRLKQILPKLQQGLREKGWSVEQIRLKVQPMTPPTTPVAPLEHKALSSGALSSFAALAREIEDSPLRDAVHALLKRRNQI